MKANKYNLIAAMIAGTMLASSPALFAQDTKETKSPRRAEGRPGGPGGARGGPMMLDKMAEDLKLTDAQKTKVQEAFKAQAEKGREIRQDSNLSNEQRREKAMALREDLNKKMKEILTAEQYEKWTKNRPQGRPGGFGGPGRAARPQADDKK